jgi:hypothetical protein
MMKRGYMLGKENPRGVKISDGVDMQKVLLY